MEEYADLTFKVTDKSLDAGAKVLIKNLKAASPKDSGEFAKSWKQGKKYKLRRYVGNTKMVNGKKAKCRYQTSLSIPQARKQDHL